ncbi:hypothetical protein IWQ61_007494, partial [Dispira simplex]
MQGWSNPKVRWSIHPEHSTNGNLANSTLHTGQQLAPGAQTQALGRSQQTLPSHMVIPGLHTGTHGHQPQQLQAYPVMATSGASVLMSHPERSGASATNGGPPGTVPMHPYLTGTSFPFSHAALTSVISQTQTIGSPTPVNSTDGAIGAPSAQFTPPNVASPTNHLPIPTPPSHKVALPSSMLPSATPGPPPTAYLTSPKSDNPAGMGSSPAPGHLAQMLPQSNELMQFPLHIAQLPATQSAELFQQLSTIYNVGKSTTGPYDTHTTPPGEDCAEEDPNDADLCIEFDSSETPQVPEPPAVAPLSVGVNPSQMPMGNHGISLPPAPHSSLNSGVPFAQISTSSLFHLPNAHSITSGDVTHISQSVALPGSSPLVQSTPNLPSSTNVPWHSPKTVEQGDSGVASVPDMPDQAIDIPSSEPQNRTDVDLVPSDSQVGPGFAGSRRGRVTFTEVQTVTLDCVFHRRPYPTPTIRQALATRLNLSELQVNAWFVRRRAKSKASGSTPPTEGANRVAVNKEDPGPGSFPYPVSAEVRNLVHEILDHKAPSTPPIPLHASPVSSVPPPSQPSTSTPPSSVQPSRQSKPAPVAPVADKRLIVRLKMCPSPSGQTKESAWVAVPSSSSAQSTPSLSTSSGGFSPTTRTSSVSLADLEELLHKTPHDASKLSTLIKGMFVCMQASRLPAEKHQCQKLLMDVKDLKILHAIAESKIPALLRVWLWKEVDRDENSEEIPTMLKTIQHLPMTVARLRKNLLGRVIRTITERNSIQNEQTRHLAKQLFEEWQRLSTLENKKPVSNPPRTVSYSMSHVKNDKFPLKPRTAIDHSDLLCDRIPLYDSLRLDPHPAVVFDCVEIPCKKSPVDIKQLVKQRAMATPLRFDPNDEENIPRRRKVPVKNVVTPSKASVSQLREYRKMFTKGGSQSSGTAIPIKRPKPTRAAGPNMLDALLLTMTGGKSRNLGNIPNSVKPTHVASPSLVPSGESSESGTVAKRIAGRLAQQQANDPLAGMPKPSRRPIDATAAGPKPSTVGSAVSDSSVNYPWPQTTSATLAPLRRKSKKDGGRRVTFAPDDSLAQVKKFYASHPADFSTPTWTTEELEQSADTQSGFDTGDAWTVGLPHEFGNARDLDRQEGRLAFKQPRVTISESATWTEPRPIAFDTVTNPTLTKAIMWRGKNSTERDIQRNRERRVLSVNYIHNDKIPPAPISPVVPHKQPKSQDLATEPRMMPFGTPDEIPPQPAVTNNDMTQSLSHLMQELGQGRSSEPFTTPGLPPAPAVSQMPTGVGAISGQSSPALDLGALLSNASAMFSNPQGLATFLSTMAMTNNLMANQNRGSGNPLANLLSNPLLANTQALLPLLQSLGSMGAAPPVVSQPLAASPTYTAGDKFGDWDGTPGPSDHAASRGPTGRPSKKHKYSHSPPPWGPPDESNDGWDSQSTSGWNNHESDWSVPAASISPPRNDYHSQPSRRPKGGRKKNTP